MKIDVQTHNAVAILSLQGEFTQETLKPFEDVVNTLLADKNNQGIVLDMSKVVLLDSQTIEALLDVNDQCRDRLRQFKLAGLDETCRKILEITRLLDQFDSYPDLAEAVKSFA